MRLGSLNVCSILTTFLAVVNAAPAWTATPFTPAAFPLAVRTPYLSAWLPQGAGAALNDVWPMFWTGQILGWAGFVNVDGQAFSFLGAPAVPGASFTKATQKSSLFTSTQSTFVLSAGPVDITVNFLSPVDATDLLKQSTPFSYMTVSAKSTDGKAHSVQVYSDISAEWVSGDNGLTANWKLDTANGIITHQVGLSSQTAYREVNDRAQYGNAYFSTPNSQGATYQSGSDVSVRAGFINSGRLPNSQDTNFRAINNAWPVFALAHDLESVAADGAESVPAVFSIGHVRDPVVRYIVKGNTLQPRHAYFWTKYSSVSAVISDFHNDYSAALTRANAFDTRVRNDAKKISDDYSAIVELSIRQALAAIEITVSKNSDGSFNADDILVFMKGKYGRFIQDFNPIFESLMLLQKISSNGNMNTVDVIFPAWPVLLYTNPALGKYLLEVLYRYQASGLYPNKWSIHDIGASYPTADGHNDGQDEAMPVEESGNMIIMALSYVQKTGDLTQAKQYLNLLEQWTEFLITDSLIPANQLSTDDFAGHLANQTNLAIKGIIGIRAMGELENIFGNTDKGSNYTAIAKDYVGKWQKLAASNTGNHVTLSYNQHDSWGLTYNLYADKLLKLDLFPATVYETQTAWYKTVTQPFGIPLDTRHMWTKSDWEIWTAAISTDIGLRDFLISSVKKFVADNSLNRQPFGDWYETPNGSPNGFRARPVAGGHLALLLL